MMYEKFTDGGSTQERKEIMAWEMLHRNMHLGGSALQLQRFKVVLDSIEDEEQRGKQE